MAVGRFFKCGFDPAAWRSRFFKLPNLKPMQDAVVKRLDAALWRDPDSNGYSERGKSIARICFHGTDCYELWLLCGAQANYPGNATFKISSATFKAGLERTTEDGTMAVVAGSDTSLDWTDPVQQQVAMAQGLDQIQAAFFKDPRYVSVQESWEMTAGTEILAGKLGADRKGL